MSRIAQVEQKPLSPMSFHLILGGVVVLEIALLSAVRWIAG